MTSSPTEHAKPQNCCDCGGFDIEWMYRCHKHGTEYCRGCSCSLCAEDDADDACDELDEFYDSDPMGAAQ